MTRRPPAARRFFWERTIRCLAVISLWAWTACGPGGDEKAPAGEDPVVAAEGQAPETPPAAVPSQVEVKVFQNDSAGSWGYDIYVDRGADPRIHQPIIPAVPGDRGFASEEDAEKAGALVAQKLRQGIMPPSVTTAELDSLGIAY